MGLTCFIKGFEYPERCDVHQAKQEGQLCLSLSPVLLPSLTKPDLT